MLSPCNPGAAVLLVMWARVGKNPRYVLYVQLIFLANPQRPAKLQICHHKNFILSVVPCCVFMAEVVEGLNCKRPTRCLASSKILTSHPPHRPASVYYPPTFAYVAQFAFLKAFWLRTQRAAVASRCATNLASDSHPSPSNQLSHPSPFYLATHLPN